VTRLAKYELRVVVEVEIEGDGDLRNDESFVEEALTELVDEEIGLHRDGDRRCGLKFTDALDFRVSFLEETAP
jgi:hypothetical protein